eukprot:99220-Amphidinium_carterae.1
MGGVNTSDRSNRHHGWGAGHCEHGCNVPDRVSHRVGGCVSTLQDRVAANYSAEIEMYLLSWPQSMLDHFI